MQLVIDIGNTRIKAGVFEENTLHHFLVFKNANELLESDIIQKYRIKKCIVASVAKENEDLKQLESQTGVIYFTSETKTPLKNLYQSISTLGSDRLAGAVGANFLFPKKNVLLIDAGTCVKYNFVSQNDEYLGGAISPGLQMRFKALHNFTARLPLLEPDKNFIKIIGANSKESILSGVQNGIINEIEGFIEGYKAIYKDLIIVLTGGDTEFLKPGLSKKNSIFADSNVVLKGLNVILNYNVK